MFIDPKTICSDIQSTYGAFGYVGRIYRITSDCIYMYIHTYIPEENVWVCRIHGDRHGKILPDHIVDAMIMYRDIEVGMPPWEFLNKMFSV